MSGMMVFIQKEIRENIRNFKVLWIPLVFIILGIIEPVTNYYLPEILKSVGNMPEGSEFLWPEFAGEDIFVSLMSQYQFIGILVIVLAFMGVISGERKSGTATLLYVRPISYSNYFLSKWLIVNKVVLGSVWLGFLASWYYITILFNKVDAGQVFAFLASYSLWIILVVTVVLVCSASLPTGGAAAVALLLTFVFGIVDSLIGMYWTLTPWKLPAYASFWFDSTADMKDFWWTAIITICLIIGLVLFGIFMSKKNAAKTTV